MSKWLLDTAGTLINMETRDMYDYVSDLLPVLEEYDEMIDIYKMMIEKRDRRIFKLERLLEALTPLKFMNGDD